MAENKIKLTKADRRSVMLRSQFLQGSWNYERMQNGGWAYSLIPALKKLYPNKDDASAALKRHLEFFNTHPYIAAPILGVTLALEEEQLRIYGNHSKGPFKWIRRQGQATWLRKWIRRQRLTLLIRLPVIFQTIASLAKKA